MSQDSFWNNDLHSTLDNYCKAEIRYANTKPSDEQLQKISEMLCKKMEVEKVDIMVAILFLPVLENDPEKEMIFGQR